MHKYVPQVQEALRKKGYPGFFEEQAEKITLGPKPLIESRTRWRFVNRAKQKCIVLAEDFVVYETSAYDVFHTFIDCFREVLEQLNSEAEIEYVTQIGLRYVDVICELDGYSPEWFIKEQFRGVRAEDLDEIDTTNQFLTLIKTTEGNLNVRSYERNGPEFMPPDLAESRLEFRQSLAPGDRYRVLDFDHIWKGEMDFTADEITGKMEDLHKGIDKTFKWIVTADALKVWQSAGGEQ
jgi:uncharacterized protein (TIGR04255 family)